jgi:hypothetical protein
MAWNNENVEIDTEAEVEEVEIDEPVEAVEVQPEEQEPEPEVAADGAITSADGSELLAPEGMVFVTYTGQAAGASLDDIKLEPGVPTLVSKEQSVTLLSHPTEPFVAAESVPIPGAADEE